MLMTQNYILVEFTKEDIKKLAIYLNYRGISVHNLFKILYGPYYFRPTAIYINFKKSRAQFFTPTKPNSSFLVFTYLSNENLTTEITYWEKNAIKKDLKYIPYYVY